MQWSKGARTAALTILALGTLGLAGTPAYASDASIKHAITTFVPKLNAGEEKLVSAIKQYKSSRNPVPVFDAIKAEIAVLNELEGAIRNQTAVSPKVKKGKSKLLAGLKDVVRAYKKLETAFAEKASSPAAAQKNAANAQLAVDRGHVDLDEGIKLLHR